MTLIVDFLLLAASGAACFYCWVLSARIKAVTSTKDGIHSGIAALTQSAEEIQQAIAATKNATTENSVELERLLKEADTKIPELRLLMKQIMEISESAVDETKAATTNLIDTLTPHIKEAQEVSYHLLDTLEAAYASTSADALSDDDIEVTVDLDAMAETKTGEAA